ncbi:hypothetical protein IE02_1102 [Fibrobacter succinogenes subsp. elongatus]|jgi:hypothetical protein|uniref:Uncharacterized protein n=1 Tax=Fibrobacter succinogenes TaxID=833 RepID=A0A380RWE4_FIBSU|nr:hypothetical protein IE02_1102 [Fibrobacter succinogenes subsp. elongatus]SUQ19858.1 hypothetical protein SAMN05661053_1102 [Fibrobacter succinogenes]
MINIHFPNSPSKIFLLSLTVVVFGLFVYLSGSYASATVFSILYAFFAVAD